MRLKVDVEGEVSKNNTFFWTGVWKKFDHIWGRGCSNQLQKAWGPVPTSFEDCTEPWDLSIQAPIFYREVLFEIAAFECAVVEDAEEDWNFACVFVEDAEEDTI